MIRPGERRAVGDEEHRRAILVRGYCRLDLLPSGTVERRIADRFQIGPEAFLALSQCLIPRLSPGIVAGEIRPDEQGAIEPGQFRHGPSMSAPSHLHTLVAAESESTELPSTRRWVLSQAARHRRAALILERRYG